MALPLRDRHEELRHRPARGLEHSLPRALRTPAGPQSRKEPRNAAALYAKRLAAAVGTLRRLGEQPCIDERGRDDAEDEQSAEEPDENRGVAHRLYPPFDGLPPLHDRRAVLDPLDHHIRPR